MKVPIVELSDCIVCGVCVETCPRVFRLNDAGYIEVLDLAEYPESEVNEAIKYCPVDCIHWSTTILHEPNYSKHNSKYEGET